MGAAIVSDFYLMTRAAYEKLSTPVAKVALRAGFTPDSITIVGTAGAVIAALTLYPIGQLWWGSFAVAFFVLADMLDGAMARQRGGGTRFGAVLDATCDRIGDGAIFCGLLWWAAFGMHSTSLVVALMICLVTSQVISYVKARAEASWPQRRGWAHRATGTAEHRAARRGAVGPAVPPCAVAAARRRMGACGGQPDHTGTARAHRAHLAGGDGADAEGRVRRIRYRGQLRRHTREVGAPPARRAGGGAVTTTPTGPQATGGSRFSFGGQVSDLGYAAGWRVVRAMPELVARNAFDAGAIYASRNGGPAQLRKNLARVLGVTPARVPDGLIRASLASYARYWREAFRLPSMDKEKLRESIEPCLLGREHVHAALEAGRGVMMPLPHSGNWDMAGVWMVQHFGTFTTVAERLKPESLYQRFIDYRESLGFEMLPLTGGERPPFEVLTERLRDNGIVCLMADRDLTRSGVEVDFFGEPTRMPAGSAKLAIATGAVVLPTHCYNTRDSWVFDVTGPLDTSSGDITAITQAMADRFAKGIAAHPADWHMLQPQWLADLSEERQAKLRGDG